MVASGDAGRQLQAAVLPDGSPVVAAYADSGDPGGLCDPATPTAGERTTWALSYAAPDGAGWRVEPVADVLHLGPPRGFDLAVAPDGTPTIAALTGEPATLPPYCGANDLGLYRRGAGGAWTVEVAVAESDEAATQEPASDFGTVVGLWPALAYDPDGNALIAYRDVHGGSLQGDDFTRADLEVAWQAGGAWRHVPVDWGRGAGELNAAAFDGEGRPVLLQVNPRDDLIASERGLWVLRSSDDGATWERFRLFRGGMGERPSLAVDPTDGAVWAAWYDGALGLPYVARLADPGRFEDEAGWEISEIGDHVYDEGRYPSIAVSAAGVVGVAYQRCGRASDGIGDCDPSWDAVVFAWRDGPVWEREVVEDEPDGLCGTYAGLVFAGEAPVVFYQCQVRHGDDFVTELRAARREAL
ncbi:MAG: hypothetical protein CVU56_23765 [Deltaproteobacteria bacterium HGW-Deltaproteobacteria-14]|nr:MAG: hypothetical protein CVU56_23765 [Deltaproteobacteria bacterium HGW-Deltaproteobacteria-14]